MNEIAEFPGLAASPRLAPEKFVPPAGETDELLDLGHLPRDGQAGIARVEKAEEITDRPAQPSADALLGRAAPVGDACATIYELQVRRKFWIKTITRQDNALGALARRALGWKFDMSDKEREKLNGRASALVSAMLKGKETKPEDAAVAAALAADIGAAQAARSPMVNQRNSVEREMRKLARTLPAARWQQSTNGFGDLGLAVIIGEAGDLSNYANPAKLWRRLGLAPYGGHAGKTWRIEKWRPFALSADEWKDYGYSGQRLAQIYGVVTEPLMKHASGTVYRVVYDHAKATFADRASTPAHAHAHAMRLMSKALVLDLWRVWHGMPPRDRAIYEPPCA
jgi:hypothetical protein